MARSHNAPLGEREMLSTITKCSPTSLTISLSRGLDAVVAENVIKYLIDQLSVISNQLVCYLWFEDSKDEAFDMLLARSGLPGVPHQLLRCESQKAQHGVASNSSSSLSDWAWNDIAWGLSLVKSSIFFFFCYMPLRCYLFRSLYRKLVRSDRISTRSHGNPRSWSLLPIIHNLGLVKLNMAWCWISFC